MAARLPAPPGPDEYDPFYAGYVAAVGERDPLALLDSQLETLDGLLSGVEDHDPALRPYAPEKWSVKEILVHLADSERIFGMRALRIGRGDPTPLPGFEQEDYVPASKADHRPLDEILGELRAVRASTLTLFRGLDPEAFTRTGTASGAPVSVRALLWIIAGHMDHHLGVLGDRYGLG